MVNKAVEWLVTTGREEALRGNCRLRFTADEIFHQFHIFTMLNKKLTEEGQYLYFRLSKRDEILNVSYWQFAEEGSLDIAYSRFYSKDWEETTLDDVYDECFGEL